LKYHRALVKRKYHLLYSAKTPRKPGPKGPEQAVINVIIEMKQRNLRYGYRRIAMQVSNTFGIDIDKDVVRREFLDQTLFWNADDLQKKLNLYRDYFNEIRGHHGTDGITPAKKANDKVSNVISIDKYQWESKCRGLFQLPIAA